jgi:hypothetical protein
MDIGAERFQLPAGGLFSIHRKTGVRGWMAATDTKRQREVRGRPIADPSACDAPPMDGGSPNPEFPTSQVADQAEDPMDEA